MAAPKDGVVPPNREGVEADPNKDEEDALKSDVCGVVVAPPVAPKREDTGAEALGVANKDEGMEGDDVGMVRRENPLPEVADRAATGDCDMPDIAGAEEALVRGPAICVDG